MHVGLAAKYAHLDAAFTGVDVNSQRKTSANVKQFG